MHDQFAFSYVLLAIIIISCMAHNIVTLSAVGVIRVNPRAVKMDSTGEASADSNSEFKYLS